MKKGFVLLEIMISIAISSMIGVIIFNSFSQINRAIKIADKIINFSSQETLIIQQLEHDLSGAFVPIIFENMQKNVEKETKTKSTPTKKTIIEETKTTTETKEVLFKKGFYSEKNDSNTSLLTFITSNPLKNNYDDNQIRIARVTYRLKKKKSDLFTLFRQETTELSLEKEEKNKNNYEMIDNIKSFSVTFTVIKKENDDKKADKKTTYETWSSNQTEKTNRSIPDYASISLIIYNQKTKQSKKISFRCNLLNNDLYADKKNNESKLIRKTPNE